MPWTIYRYIFKDMLKLLATSAAVLVLVISFAAAIKPLSEGLLGPGALVKYVLYMAPSMLGFVLPFAGAFASTLVYTRLVNDNELLVCRAGGISYRAMLVPVVFLGLGLTLGLFYLGNWVVPSFYKRAAHMLEKDVMQVVVNQVQQLRPVKLGNMVLYADAADDSREAPVIPGDKVQPTKLIRLRGVAVGQLDETGRLRNDSTAEAADVLLYRVGDQTWATMRLENVAFYDAVRGDLFLIEEWLLPQILLPSPVKDDPSFLSWPEIRELRDEPERYDRIREHKQVLAEAMATERLLRELRESSLQAKGRDGMVLLGVHGQERYILRSPVAEQSGRWLKLSSRGAEPVRVEYERRGEPVRRIEAQSGLVWTEAGDPQPEPWVRIELKNASVYDVGRERHGSEHTRMTLPRSRWPEPVLEPLSQLGSGPLLAEAAREYGDAESVMSAGWMLRHQIVDLSRQVVAQLHERAALSVACLLVLSLGAVMSMAMGGGMPLVIYFWSFLSAIVVVMICHSGENLAGHPDLPRSVGLSVIWMGNLLLLVALSTAYLKLAKN